MDPRLSIRGPSSRPARLRALCACVVLAFSAALPLAAQDKAGKAQQEEPAVSIREPEAGQRRLTLRQCILAALEHNYDVRAARLDPEIQSAEIDVEKAEFDPVFKASVQRDYKRRPTVSVLDTGITIEGFTVLLPTLTGVTEEDRDYKASISKKFTTGTEVTVSQSLHRTSRPDSKWQVLNPYYNSEIAMEVIQPLLKGAGFTYNRAGIVVARNNVKVSEAEFRETLLANVRDVEIAYWNLVRARGFVEAAEKSLERAKALYDTVELRVRAGSLYPHALDEAEAQMAIQEEALNTAKLQVKNAEDLVKQLMGMSDADCILARVGIVPVDQPEFLPIALDWQQAEATALEQRPELRAAELNIKSAQTEIKRAENENQIQLDATVYGSFLGLEGNPGNTIDVQNHNDFYNFSVGGMATYPVRMRASRAALKQARLSLRKEGLSREQVRQTVIVEVRAALREVLQKAKAVQSARVVVEARVRSRDDQMKLFRVGKSTMLDVVEAQERLAVAENEVVSALADYRIAICTLFQTTGTLLERHGVELQSESLRYKLLSESPPQ